MLRKYGPEAQEEVKAALREMKQGTLTTGRSGVPVRSCRLAIAIGLAKARMKGIDVKPRPEE